MADVGVDTLYEGDLPEGAANFTSLAAHAAKTQEDWDDELKDAEIARWGDAGVLGGLFQGLAQGKPFLVALIQAIIQKTFGVADTPTTIAQAFTNMQSRFTSKWLSLVGANHNAATGIANTGQGLANLQSINQQILATLSEHNNILAALQARRTHQAIKGALYTVNFSDYPNGDMPADWTVTYSGAGTSTIGITNGLACWRNINNADRDAKIVYDDPTETQYQFMRGTMSVPPEPARAGGTTPKFHAIGRVSSDGLSYLWARAYNAGFLTFKGEIGYTLNGVETTWASDVPLTWSLDMTVKWGVGTNPRQHQVFSGNTLVKEWDETYVNGVSGTVNTSRSLVDGDWKIVPSGTFTLTWDGNTTGSISTPTSANIKSALDALSVGTFYVNGASGTWFVNTPDASKTLTISSGTVAQQFPRQWGAIAQIRGGTAAYATSGKIAGCSIADNLTPDVEGSTARMSRTATSSVNYQGGGSVTAVPSSFFDNIEYESLDIDANTADGTFTVVEAKPYIISARIQLSTSVLAWGNVVLQVYRSGSWQSMQYGAPLYTDNASAALVGNWVQYLNAGEKVRLATVRGGTNLNALTGDSDGIQTYFGIVGIG